MRGVAPLLYAIAAMPAYFAMLFDITRRYARYAVALYEAYAAATA